MTAERVDAIVVGAGVVGLAAARALAQAGLQAFELASRIAALQPGYAGIRSEISGPGEPAADFPIQGPARHGLPGLVNLLGIEPPRLTSCLAIGEQVREALTS